MPKIGHIITKLTVGDRVYNSPEVWNSAHKLKKAAKKAEYLRNLRADSSINASYEVHDVKALKYADIVNYFATRLDEPKYALFAPWNSVFRKSNTIIVFKK
ncbi:hypothetical protein IJ541_03940 [bacterium]|nr:hypothetical protein [bacterium]